MFRSLFVAIAIAFFSGTPSESTETRAVGHVHQPVTINHAAGEKIDAIFAVAGEGGWIWSSLPEKHFVRRETETILAAPPGEYIITTGKTIILSVEDGEAGPAPPPGPTPGPEPQPEPEPSPVVDGVVWVLIFEQTSERGKYPSFIRLLTSGYLSELDAKPDFEYRSYDVDSLAAKQRAKFYEGLDLPAMALVTEDGRKLDARTVKSQTDVKMAIREVTGRE